MNKVDVKFSEWLQKGFDLYKDNIGLLIVAALLVVVLSAVTVGILAGPMMAGLAGLVLALLDKQEPKPEIGDVFKGFNVFVHAFLFTLIVFVVLLLGGLILGVIPFAPMLWGYVVGTFMVFGIYLIVDRNLECWPAIQTSFNTVKTNFWPFLGFTIVAGLIGSIGALACGIGLIVTLPLQVCMLAVAYRDVFGRGGNAAEGVAIEPEPVPAEGDDPKES